MVIAAMKYLTVLEQPWDIAVQLTKGLFLQFSDPFNVSSQPIDTILGSLYLTRLTKRCRPVMQPHSRVRD